jgi:hypothetical protein
VPTLTGHADMIAPAIFVGTFPEAFAAIHLAQDSSVKWR